MTETTEFVLYNFEPPSDDDLNTVHTCRMIPGGGSALRGEFLVNVSPPVNSNGIAHDQLRLRGRGSPPYLSDDLKCVDLGATDTCAVYVSSLVAPGSFRPVLATVSLEVPESVRRGGFWKWFQDALSDFHDREGHLDVPNNHVEQGLHLGRYVKKVKREHHYKTLGPEKERWLESLPGWNWKVDDLPSPAVIDPSVIREYQLKRQRESGGE